MADIIHLSAHRPKVRPSIDQVLAEATDFITSDWERFARSNRLNDYFVSLAGVRADASINYLSDLNAISRMESRLGMTVTVTAPQRGTIGWRASFALKTTHSTTPDLPFETYARCFSILLYIKVKRDLLVLDALDEL